MLALTEPQRAAFVARMREHFDWLSEPQKIAIDPAHSELSGFSVTQIAQVNALVRDALEVQATAYRAQQLKRNSWLLARFLAIEIARRPDRVL